MRAVRRLSVPILLCCTAPPALAAADTSPSVHPALALPFVLLLLSIAVAPFVNRHWWERNYPYVAVALAAIPVAYYLGALDGGGRLLHAALEYVSFIVLIGSLFVVAGGIHIRIRGRSTPLSNLGLLAIGAVISNIVGTTGASMVLIRPYIRVNRYRIKPYHIVFFIFIVSNMGGALTPIGDPPLFLGYLRGIPFFWVAESLWLIWLVGIGIVMGVFFILDTISFRALSRRLQHNVEEEEEQGEVLGLHNIVFLVMILIAVFIQHPVFVRELLMIVAAAGSYFSTAPAIHRKNDFNFHPIREVAILFFGIFATMIPALDWLEANASALGVTGPAGFYWATGLLSAVLDNAPTYLNFLTAEIGLLVPPDLVQNTQEYVRTYGVAIITGPASLPPDVGAMAHALLRYHYDAVASGTVTEEQIQTAYLLANAPMYVAAVSIAAVFFGACTYIGNGPNFMVKSIAEQSGVRCPSFFGYVAAYTLPVLVPVFLLIWLLFFRA